MRSAMPIATPAGCSSALCHTRLQTMHWQHTVSSMPLAVCCPLSKVQEDVQLHAHHPPTSTNQHTAFSLCSRFKASKHFQNAVSELLNRSCFQQKTSVCWKNCKAAPHIAVCCWWVCAVAMPAEGHKKHKTSTRTAVQLASPHPPFMTRHQAFEHRKQTPPVAVPPL